MLSSCRCCVSEELPKWFLNQVADAEEIAPEVSCEIVIQKWLTEFGLSLEKPEHLLWDSWRSHEKVNTR